MAAGRSGNDFGLARYIAVTPQQQIEQLIEDVQGLAGSGVLNNGQGNSLIKKHQAAIQQLDSGREEPAKEILQAFINQIRDFIDGGILTSAKGQPLIDLAQAVIDQLGGGLP